MLVRSMQYDTASSSVEAAALLHCVKSNEHNGLSHVPYKCWRGTNAGACTAQILTVAELQAAGTIRVLPQPPSASILAAGKLPTAVLLTGALLRHLATANWTFGSRCATRTPAAALRTAVLLACALAAACCGLSSWCAGTVSTSALPASALRAVVDLRNMAVGVVDLAVL